MLRDVPVLLSTGRGIRHVIQQVGMSKATFHRWRQLVYTELHRVILKEVLDFWPAPQKLSQML